MEIRQNEDLWLFLRDAFGIRLGFLRSIFSEFSTYPIVNCEI